ncbi:MAG: ATP-binding protein [Myxococcaceae bacterium]
MSSPQTLLHGAELLAALTETAVEVQRAKGLEAVLETAAAGLERFGAQVSLVCLQDGGLRQRYLSPSLTGLRSRLGASATSLKWAPPVGSEPQLIKPFLPYLEGFARQFGWDVRTLGLPNACAVAPLATPDRWGALVVLHDELREDDLAALRLFALQLGSAIQVREGLELVERRQIEQDLVQQLAAAGPTTNANELCRRALDAVCRTTHSHVGTLHRYDHATGAYSLVGEALGARGPVVELYRRFTIDPSLVRPLAAPVAQLPAGAAELAQEGIAHLAILPLSIDEKPIGLLTLGRRVDLVYERESLKSAEVLGVQMASLLERARLYDEAGRLYRDLKVSYDELERTQQELVRHERLAALGELAAVMAHEVRNPLGVIFNSLTTLKRLLRPSGDAEMLLNMVGEEADRLNRIVGDLLDFVRPYELVKKPMAVEPILSSAVDAATQSSVPANVKVVTEIPREIPPFPLDAHLLKQALVNLIVNAAQAMPRGGTVTLRATVETEGGTPWLTLRVKDEGMGLSERATARMFQPFFTTKATGTGLGLAVVKRIVDAHLGDVSARPNDAGQGTTFVVRFPPTTETRSALTPPRPSPAMPVTRGG